MSEKYLLAIDQGTTSSRTVVYDKMCRPLAQEALAHKQLYENSGWVTHDACEIFDNVIETVKRAICKAGISADRIDALGITNQRETVVAWDKSTGRPIYPAIVWSDNRTAEMCKIIKRDGFEPTIRQKTGLFSDPYFSATKMRWILENVAEARLLLNTNKLAFGTVDSYLVFRLTGGEKHVTDFTNASRTMLFNINTLKWDEELLGYFNIPPETLPQVCPSSGVAGYADKNIFGVKIPIAGIAGDQQSALFGQNCFNKSDIKNTCGTGCFILMNIGNKPIVSDGLLTTIAWNVGGETVYASEGSIFCAGSTIDWLINSLKLVSGIQEIESILAKQRDRNGEQTFFVPAFSGLGAPEWDMNARAAALGMTLGTGKNEFVHAVCDSISYSVYDAVEYMRRVTGVKIEALNVDGGISKNDYIMQFQADILGIPVYRPENVETTALGAAKLAGLGTSFFSSIDELIGLKEHKKVFLPQMKEAERKNLLARWRKSVERAGNWE